MNSTEERERNEKETEDLATILFWIDRSFLIIFFLFSGFFSVLIGLLFSSPGPSGIGGFWLFLLDRFIFLLALSSHETVFVWCRTVFISLVDHSVCIIEYLISSNKPHHTCISTELKGTDDEADDEGDVIKELEKMRELLEELREEGKKMDIEIEFIEQSMHSDLETHRKTLSLKLLELREELRDDGEKMGTYMELMKNFLNSELVTLRGDLNLNSNYIWEGVPDELRSRDDEHIKAWIGKLKSVAEDVHESYLVFQETAKAAKTTAERANLTYLVVEAVSEEIQSKWAMVKEEAFERFFELREEVCQMWLDFETRKTEAEAAADRAEEELSYAMVEVMEAVKIRPWEDYKTG